MGEGEIIKLPKLSDAEMASLARAHDDYVIAVDMGFQVPQAMLIVKGCTVDEWLKASDNERRMYETEIIPFPPNYWQDEWKLFYEEIKPIFDKHFQDRYILTSWAMPVILLVVFVILTMIIGA